MASKAQNYDRFDRSEKRGGGKRGSYTKNVSKNAAKKSRAILSESVREALFCIALPPYGIYRVWTRSKDMPLIKIGLTALAALIMFLWFLLIIPDGKPQPVSVARVRATAVE